ncbi:early activation antigen CD69-like isoform X2 [Emydura macquarii macquarii]|uniref:early activation antigen CD69-like isoform X2 n=1 Tax=Emydura macquarii macquarii TaxID=1129001 RepID=UPI00352B871C
MSLVLESTSRSQTDKVWSESCPVEKMEPDPLVGSQEETQMKQMETTHEIIPPEGGKSRKAGRTGLLSRLKAGALHWGVPSVVLNLILLLLLIIIILTAQLAKKCELCPADPVCPVATCPEGWLGYLGKCYYFSEVEANWTSSQSNCAAFNTSLAVIDSVREMGLCVRVLWGLYADLNCRGIPSGRIQLLSSPFYVTGAALPTQDFVMRYRGSDGYWIGLHREPGQPWKWTNGTEFNNWFTILGREECAFISHDIVSSSCSRKGNGRQSKVAVT